MLSTFRRYNMTDNKTPRSAQTRATEERRKPWQPPSQLDAPPCPDGYKQRWLRHRVNGADDTKNINAKTEVTNIEILFIFLPLKLK